MLTFLECYGQNYKYSQNREEGVLIECASRMELSRGSSVEIGGHNGRFCSNTALLIERGWDGLFVETDYLLHLECKENWKDNPRVRCQCSRVDPLNINAFVDETCDVLSIDCDGPDYEIFKGLEAKPKIVIIEIDSSIPPQEYAFNVEGGSGYRPMVELAISKNYFVLCHSGNVLMVANEYRGLFPEIEGDGLSNAEVYFNRAWIKEAA